MTVKRTGPLSVVPTESDPFTEESPEMSFEPPIDDTPPPSMDAPTELAPGKNTDNEGFNTAGYRVSEAGVFFTQNGELGKAIAPAFISLMSLGTDEHDHRYMTLHWRHGTRETKITRPRVEILCGNIAALAALGAPITASNKSQIQNFLLQQETDCYNKLPKVHIYTQQGWGPRCETYVIGEQVIGGEGEIVGGDRAMIEALAPKGDLKSYLDIIRGAITNRLAVEMAWAAGYVAPLLRLMNERSWLLYLWGKSGHGKSAVQALALSPWGNPTKLILTGSFTATALEARLAKSRDGLVVVDDTQLTDSKKLLDYLAYQIAAGVGKARGTMTGAAQPLADWLCIGFVSGEKQYIKQGTPLGTRNRTVELCARPMESSHPARDLHIALSQHHGLTGKLFIEALLKHVVRPNKVGVLSAKCREFQQAIDSMPNIIDKTTELSRHVAHLMLADTLVRQWILGEDSVSADRAATLLGRSVITQVLKTLPPPPPDY